jgi:hypothetical protein
VDNFNNMFLVKAEAFSLLGRNRILTGGTQNCKMLICNIFSAETCGIASDENCTALLNDNRWTSRRPERLSLTPVENYCLQRLTNRFVTTC